MPRKSTPKVKDGRVQRKNNWEPSASYRDCGLSYPALERQRPGEGFRHLLRRPQIESFIALLPDWDELSVGLNAIVLAPGQDAMGLHEPGIIYICAWENTLWWANADPEFIEDHRHILDLVGADVARENGSTLVKWTEGQARAFQLVHVFVHELGHHHDQMSTRSKRTSARGERYAEDYANRHTDRIWKDYLRTFGRDL